MNFDEFLQDFVNRSYDDLLAIARRGMGEAIPALERHFDTKETVAKFLILLVGTCAGADATLTDLEVRFVQDLLGSSFDTASVRALAKTCCDEESRELIDGVIDSLGKEEKAALCTTCISVMSVDETISRSEIDFIKRLLG